MTPTTTSDAGEILETFTAAVTRYMFLKPARKLDDTLEFIEKSREATEAGMNLQLTISLKATREFLDCCGLREYESVQVPELGVWIRQQAHGHGYGKEAVVALAHWAVEHLDISGLVYPVDRRNAASRRIPDAPAGKVVSTTITTGLGGDRLEPAHLEDPEPLSNEATWAPTCHARAARYVLGKSPLALNHVGRDHVTHDPRITVSYDPRFWDVEA